MKTRIVILILLSAVVFSCEEDSKPVDAIYDFVAFKGPATISVNEFVNTEVAFPLVLELRAFAPYSEDIEVALEVTGSNASENTDFTISPRDAVTIPAGSFTSDTLFIKTIDNVTGSPEARSFELRIKSISADNIKIGLGINEPKNVAVTVNILDDECSETTAVFNSSTLNNTVNYGEGDIRKPVSGVVVANSVKVTGDLIDYGKFSNAELTITLTPDSEGATRGIATFQEQETGTDSDGYVYKFVQVGAGSYDVCSGMISIEYDIYYEVNDGWELWYRVTNVFSVE